MKRENNHGEGGHVCPSFFQENTTGSVRCGKVKEKTQTESKQKACMGMEMEISSQSGKS